MDKHQYLFWRPAEQKLSRVEPNERMMTEREAFDINQNFSDTGFQWEKTSVINQLMMRPELGEQFDREFAGKEVYFVLAHRLASNGDINLSYSSDKISGEGRVRKSFRWRNSEWIATGGDGKRQGAMRLIPVADYKSATFTYQEKSEQARKAKTSMTYEGIRVFAQGKREMILSGEVTLKAAEIRQVLEAIAALPHPNAIMHFERCHRELMDSVDPQVNWRDEITRALAARRRALDKAAPTPEQKSEGAAAAAVAVVSAPEQKKKEENLLTEGQAAKLLRDLGHQISFEGLTDVRKRGEIHYINQGTPRNPVIRYRREHLDEYLQGIRRAA